MTRASGTAVPFQLSVSSVLLVVFVGTSNVVVSYLDLGGNQLNGTIPSTISAMTGLGYVMSLVLWR